MLPNLVLSDYSTRDHFETVSDDASLIEVVRKLAEPNCHRVAVSSSEHANQFLGVITQSGFCEYLIEEHAILMSEYKQKIRDIIGDAQHNTRPIWSVKMDTKTYDALKLMSQKKVSGLAVVGDAGTLVDVFSASDFTVSSSLPPQS